MEASFWHRRWQKNEIGFHESDGSYLLKKYFDRLSLSPSDRVFVPLCGKTRDIAWLLSKEISVLGIELNEQAIVQLFTELGVSPKRANIEVSGQDNLQHFHHTFSNALTIDIYQGDFFALDAKLLGNIDAVYDRASLVALPKTMRENYTAHLQAISCQSQQLLICYEYEEGLIQGPPHSVDNDEVITHYQQSYKIENLHKDRVEGGFREQTDVFEAVYLLYPKSQVD
jgi:thiopurine S-methyltransferase